MSDDFWNDSSTSRFNFDDDEEECIEINEDSIFSGVNPEKEEYTSVPILSIVPRRNLDMILSGIQTGDNQDPTPVEEIAKKMFCGRKYTLNYRTLENKIVLLDAALETMDGNAILEATIYLAKTLSRSLFMQCLSKREVALKHYSYYLIFNNRLRDLEDLYMATGATSNLRIACFLSLKNIIDKHSLTKRLDQHIESMHHCKDLISDLHDYKNFISWQIDKKLNAATPTEQLAELFRNSDSDISQFQQIMKVADFQYEWTQLNTTAAMKDWKRIKELYITENWLIKKKAFRSCIKPELFLMTLKKHNSPMELLENFLSSISNTEKSLPIAKQIGLHKFVIDCYVCQRDRLALVLYKNNISVGSPEYEYLENILQSRDKKWKN